jgi:NAD(P)-dependent dehydrogenase (short-subunit alcohol dehydrogenase family)
MPNKNALVVGASRGLGLGLVEQLAQNGWRVTGTVRDSRGKSNIEKLPIFTSGSVHIETLDINDRLQVDAFAQAQTQNIYDLIFVNAGVFGPDHQSVMQTSAEDIGHLIYTNAIAPAQIGELLCNNLQEKTGVLAFMSSLRGSVAENSDGASSLYRISKAALNMAARSLFPVLEKRGITMLLFHPGWVQTDMGGEGAPLTVDESVRGMLQEIDARAGSGKQSFIDYQGNIIPW